ncbi:hypothetical protein TWF506_006384 [Arthrobotrys conoides]|uniref:Aminoglycoside phosphotransferase domain-containing protein n=1 Tax=Arthrobotrys conoides TaxID=74498 RepID=A0AAN8NTI1_9PEZI
MSKQRLPTDVEKPHPNPLSETTNLNNDESSKKPSDAAIFNSRVFAKLQRALAADPEVDLVSLLPFEYQSRLAARKIVDDKEDINAQNSKPLVEEEMPIRLPEGETRVIYPLSSQVKALLEIDEDNEHPTLLEPLARLVKKGEVLFCTQNARSKYVIKCSEDIVLKSATLDKTLTEYTTLLYLQEHRPGIPVPKPHGLIISGNYSYIFMSYVPGVTLDKAWPTLSHSNKLYIQQTLNDFSLDLRKIPHPAGSPLGGVAGEGCKDTRRHTKISEGIYTPEELWDFQYLNAKSTGRVYFEFLDRLTKPCLSKEIAFTHGDVRDENIILVEDGEGGYGVSGIIDWEMGGFYPADFECIKITKVFGRDADNDWFLYLPPCISPEIYPVRWLADRVWGPHVA